MLMLAGCGFSGKAPSSELDAPGGSSVIGLDSQSSATTSVSPTLRWSHTVGGNLDRSLLVVGLSIEKTSGASVQGITFAGAALAKAGAAVGDACVKAELWYLLAPPAGANDVIVTSTTTLNTDGAVGGAVSLSGVDQATPIATTMTNGGAGQPSTTITTVNDGAWVIDTIMVDNGNAALPEGAGEQAQWNAAQGNSIRGAGSTVGVATHGTTTMSWATSSDHWAQIVAEIKP